MKHLELAKWLKRIIIIIGLFGLLFCVWIIPSFGKEIVQMSPDLAYLFWPCLIFVWISAILCYVGLFYFWKICTQIENDQSFTQQTAHYLKAISRLSLIETVFCIIGSALLFVLNALHFVVLLLFILCIFFGFAISVSSAIFSRLSEKAAQLKQEQDLTI